jgi:hypothetical protein
VTATQPETGRRVRATVNYIRNPPPAGAPPLTYVTEDEARSTMIAEPGRVVWIDDVRDTSTTLAREGFELVAHTCTVSDFDAIEEDPAVDRRYEDEMTELLASVSGATRVVMLGPGKKRFGERATGRLARLKNARPARYPHGDTTDASASALAVGFARGVLGVDLAEVRRWAVFNTWRAVTPPPQDHPLAVCDARTIRPDDRVPVVAVTEERGLGELEFETTGYVANPEHRWCWFPDMTPDEVLVFATHDSDPDRPHQVAHTAFTDASCPPGTPTRGSVEIRGLALFD